MAGAVILVMLSTGFPARSYAIPLFARQYNKSCFTCHVTEPMLNEVGRRFQANGYQFPFETPSRPVWDQLPLLLSFAVSPSVTHSVTKDALAGTTSKSTGFDGFGVDLLTAGDFSSHFSWYGDLTVDPSGAAGIESLFLIGHAGSVNVSLGKQILRTFFPHQFTPTNGDYLAQAYDPYAISGIAGDTSARGALPKAGSNSLLIEEASYAVSAFGWIPEILDGFRYQVAYTSGNAALDIGENNALFLSADQTILYANNASLRIGAWYYGGKQTMADTLAGEANAPSRIAVGIDIYDPWTKRIDVMGQYITAKDTKIFDGTGYSNQTMKGGFVGLAGIIVPEKLYAYARYDFMNVDQLDYKETQTTIAARYHFLPNVYLWGEISLDKKTAANAHAYLPPTEATASTVSLGTTFAY
jgi:hypothetical protein